MCPEVPAAQERGCAPKSLQRRSADAPRCPCSLCFTPACGLMNGDSMLCANPELGGWGARGGGAAGPPGRGAELDGSHRMFKELLVTSHRTF